MHKNQEQHTYTVGAVRKPQRGMTMRRVLGAMVAAFVIYLWLPSGTAQAWDGPNYRCSDGTNLESAECAPSDDWKNMFDGHSLDGWTVKATTTEQQELQMPFNVAYPNTRWAKIRIQDNGQIDHGYQNLEYIHDFDDYCGTFELIARVYGAPGQRGGTGIQFASHWNKSMAWYSGPQIDVDLGPHRELWILNFPWIFESIGHFGYWRTGFIYDEYTNSQDANAWDGNDSTWFYPKVNYGKSFIIKENDVNNLPGVPWGNNIRAYHPMKNDEGIGGWHTLYAKWAVNGSGHNTITTIVDGVTITDQQQFNMGLNELKQHGGRWGKIALQLHRQLPFNDTTLDVHYKGLYYKTSGMKNVAKNKVATQRSTDYGGVASRAVDGNTSGEYWQNSVTHTQQQDNPWWKVDLGGPHDLEGITVWNRSDCCTERLKTFQVKYRDANDNIMKTKNVVWPTGENTVDPNYDPRTVYVPLKLDNVHKVMIQAFGNDRILSLAEVQVWGRDSNADLPCARPSGYPDDYTRPPY